MKLKKILSSRPVIIGVLIVLCIGVFAASLYMRKDRTTDFVPDPIPTGQLPGNEQLNKSWEENKRDTPTGNPDSTMSSSGEDNPSTDENQYPKEVENGDNKVVVDFTDPAPEKPKPPEKPTTSADLKDSKKPPEYKPEEVKPSATTSAPVPGSKNEKGEIYDPVFGWIKPGAAEAKPIDNDKDPNEQVGSMD